MATTKKVKKEDKVKEEKAEVPHYFYAVGKRKTSIAQVKVFETKNSQNQITVNERNLDEYFSILRLREQIMAPLALAGQNNKFDIIVKVYGGGISAQSGAVRLGISRALVKFSIELKKSLRDRGFLTRDSRRVERKKPGLRKARRSPQWAKR